LTAGVRGPTLVRDHHLREKVMHFDHERIPERVMHARCAAAHGIFESYGSAAKLSRAGFLAKGVQTPVFVRFSNVLGSRGSADTVRDTRDFATKFYTEEGNFDLVGNNIPVFFIQDGIKFPDVVHAAKPHPDREIPQAQTAHDSGISCRCTPRPPTTRCGPCPTAAFPARGARWRASGCTPSGWWTPPAARP
jgi:catalase